MIVATPEVRMSKLQLPYAFRQTVTTGDGDGPGGAEEDVMVVDGDAIDEYDEMLSEMKDEMLVLACDGVWDVLTPQIAVDLGLRCGSAQHASEVIAHEAFQRGSLDNLTVVVVFLQQDRGGEAPPPQRKPPQQHPRDRRVIKRAPTMTGESAAPPEMKPILGHKRDLSDFVELNVVSDNSRR